MPVIQDKEFGKITIRRSPKARQVRVRIAPDGTLRASLPMYAPMFMVKRLVNSSREELRKLLQDSHPQVSYSDGMIIGKSHTLFIRTGTTLKSHRTGQHIIVTIPPSMNPASTEAVSCIRKAVVAALRVEAKSHLPMRLKYLADQHGFSYERVRFSHASGRWGSCSSTGTISLNIALMKLPFELIDYVLVHELAHTVHMNHSELFWTVVRSVDPHYKIHRKALEKETPSI